MCVYERVCACVHGGKRGGRGGGRVRGSKNKRVNVASTVFRGGRGGESESSD